MSKNLTSPIQKRSIVIEGLKTSVSLEDQFWAVLNRIKDDRNKGLDEDERRTTLSSLVAEIDEAHSKKGKKNRSSALRLHVLDWALGQADLLEVTEAAQ